jgi:hypothetical protein
MRVAKTMIQTLWWFALACVPIAILRVASHLYAEIGCPLQGDCYRPGTYAVFELELLAFVVAVLVWPACFWFLGGRLLFQRLGLWRAPNSAVKRDAPQAARPLP